MSKILNIQEEVKRKGKENIEIIKTRTYCNPDDFPDIMPEVDLQIDELPKFIQSILECANIEHVELIKFLTKFVFMYVYSEEIQNYCDGWTFLFTNGNYIGAFKTKSDAYSFTKNGDNIYIHNMYPQVIYEYTETVKYSNLII